MKNALILSLVLLLTGCVAPTPGTVSSSTSKFDGTQQIKIEPGWVYDGITSSTIKLGGFWNSKMDDTFVMVAFYTGTDSIRSLSFNIDGQFKTITPTDRFTDFSYDAGNAYNRAWSSQRFEVPLAFAQELVSAKKVMVKMELSKSFTEGEFRSGMTMAKPAFVKFLAQVEKAKTGTK